MTLTRAHADTDRYYFDFTLCTPAKGYAQVDTGQDAWYFGTWANPAELTIVNYCEGDITTQQFTDQAEFAGAVRAIKEWNDAHGHGFRGIDGMCNPAIIEGFRALGLTDLLH